MIYDVTKMKHNYASSKLLADIHKAVWKASQTLSPTEVRLIVIKIYKELEES